MRQSIMKWTVWPFWRFNGQGTRAGALGLFIFSACCLGKMIVITSSSCSMPCFGFDALGDTTRHGVARRRVVGRCKTCLLWGGRKKKIHASRMIIIMITLVIISQQESLCAVLLLKRGGRVGGGLVVGGYFTPQEMGFGRGGGNNGNMDLHGDRGGSGCPVGLQSGVTQPCLWARCNWCLSGYYIPLLWKWLLRSVVPSGGIRATGWARGMQSFLIKGCECIAKLFAVRS